MSRGLSNDNLAAAQGDTVAPVTLVIFAFDTPVYVHSGSGTITYDGNDYLGVGTLGDISGMEESEDLAPVMVQFSLSGIDSTFFTEVFDTGNYGDVITVYHGYRNADTLALIDDPTLVGRFFFEHASIRKGETNVAIITAQHELARLDDKPGQKFTDEDQRATYSSDVGYEFVADVGTKELIWGGGNVQPGRDPDQPPNGPKRRFHR